MDVSLWIGGLCIEITVDSDAEESVCPKTCRGQHGMGEVSRKMNLVNASGGKIYHYRQREVVVSTSASF